MSEVYQRSPSKRGRSTHEWGVVAQWYDGDETPGEPGRVLYREFWYCPLCKRFQEAGGGYISKRDIPRDALCADSTVPFWEGWAAS